MKKSSLRTVCAGVGLTLAMITGSPAYADDVELLLSNPAASNAAKPNILFILDSSGSMTSIETTQEPFDASESYNGSCSRNRLYWTTSGGTPSCGSDKNIAKSSFVCAQGLAQAAAAGSYTDTMAQYRRRNGKFKWRTIRSGDSSSPVECRADSGQHGNGTNGEVYARIGINQPQFTAQQSQEVAWGSSPTHRIYTIYDGNYLNWLYNPPGTSMSRTQIVKEVTKNVLASINNVNVGFMRFHFSQGGPVTFAIKDLDSSRAAANAVIDALPASGWTPLSETLYESALYWRGMNRLYGGLSSTDPDAFVPNSTTQYQNPTNFACAKNFTVLLTDGEPTQDTDAYSRVPTLPNFTTTMGRSNCLGGNVDGACLDDIAEYLSKEDINPNIPGLQTVTTYTIGFKVDLPLLRDTAEKSGGQYYLAEDVATLTTALTDIVTNIFDRDVSFTAPTVAVNAFNRTQHLNDMYVSVFRAKDNHHWPGNLKKYRIGGGIVRDSNDNPAVDPQTGFFADASKSFWTTGTEPDGPNVHAGGALSQLPDPDSRRLFTNIAGNDLSAAGNQIDPANASSFTLADFGLTGAVGEPDITTIIEWARGVDVLDEDNDASTLTRRVMGDTLHSQPASIVYGPGPNPGEFDIVVYTATNDGYLHAIDGKTGVELWSFIPSDLLGSLADLFFDNNISFKHYGIDGDLVPIVADRNNDGVIEPGTDAAYLVFGLRRGGDKYYALDVTDKNAPKIKWIVSYPEFGQTWSPVSVARVKTTNGSSADDAVLILGAGYDTAHDQPALPSSNDGEGTGIFMLDLETGAELWRAGPSGSGADLELGGMTRSIPSRIRVLDMSGDGFADRMYASDLGGQIWRFDITNGNNRANLVAGGVMAQLGGEGVSSPSLAETRRFYTSPDVSLFSDLQQDKRYLSISIGSGYRAHPLDKRNEDRFYSIRDSDVFLPLTQTQYDQYPVIDDSMLVEVSGKLNVVLNPGDRGWQFTLPAGEKILSDSQTFDNSVFFVSFEPQASTTDPCQAGLSLNRLYRVSVINGDPVMDISVLDPNDPAAADAARVTELDQGGIAPKPTFLFPSPDDPDNCQGDECAPDPIGCVGVECFNPNFNNSPVRTLWTQDGIQ